MRRFFTLFVLYLILSFCQNTNADQTQTVTLDPAGTLYNKWTGDLDGMVKRRLIRVLTVYSKTFYFLDKDTQRGIVYDAMKAFEDDLNKKLKTGNLRVHVIYFPVSRDKLISGLNEGIGDIACANLTITEERKKLVDFTTPILQNASELVITGPASPKISTLDDLSGQEIFVRKSSSYYEHL
ncbi:transporter substrate-binding domain-containing protein, partial [bacterium]|nr:transporter substrate-binding domain-containing protein [bacterium]